MASSPRTPADGSRDALGGQPPSPRDSFRARVRGKPGLGQAWRVGVFVLGLLFVLGGIALVVLPGPLTIPPIIVGLWLWSTEFAWAHRFFTVWRKKGQQAWAQARQHPVSSTVVTVGGLVGGGLLIWATLHFDVVGRARDAVGL
jgi:hypothetical protein